MRMREPKIHVLKTAPEYWEAISSGDKRVELRYNDRDFQVGDHLVLIRWHHAYDTTPDILARVHTADAITCRVRHIVAQGPWLVPGHIAMSIEPLSAHTTDRGLAENLMAAYNDFMRRELAGATGAAVREWGWVR